MRISALIDPGIEAIDNVMFTRGSPLVYETGWDGAVSSMPSLRSDGSVHGSRRTRVRLPPMYGCVRPVIRTGAATPWILARLGCGGPHPPAL